MITSQAFRPAKGAPPIITVSCLQQLPNGGKFAQDVQLPGNFSDDTIVVVDFFAASTCWLQFISQEGNIPGSQAGIPMVSGQFYSFVVCGVKAVRITTAASTPAAGTLVPYQQVIEVLGSTPAALGDSQTVLE